MERALKIVVELLRLVVAATIVLIGLVIFLSPPNSACKDGCPPVANLRTINTAEVTYKVYLASSVGTYGSMTDLIAAGLLDDTFTGTKAGYKYSITLDATGSVYTAEALPVSSETGRYGYYSVTDAVVRYSTNASIAPRAYAGRPVQ